MKKISNPISDNKAPEITVVITRSYETFSLVKDCLNSLEKQINCNSVVLFLDQHVSQQTAEYVKSLKSKNLIFKYISIPAKSLSYARNYGLKYSKTNFVAYCDVDCVLAKNWLNEICTTFKAKNAAIVGTKIEPIWNGKTRWYHKSKFIREFYSMLDVSSTRCSISKVIGASFALDKSKIHNEAYFNENLGRTKGNYLGGEETDLCQRVKNKGYDIYYTPFTTAHHQVSPNRLNDIWLLRRAYYGGISRALRGGKAEPFNQKYTLIDRLAIVFILPFYITGYIKGIISK